MQDTMLGRNIIITERCSSLRQLGRNALRGKWKNAIIAMIIVMICIDLPQMIFDNLFGLNAANFFTNEGFTYGMDVEVYQQIYNSVPQSSILSLIWTLLISGAIELGTTIYFLASFRGHDVVPKDVFLGFERFGKALGLWLYQLLFITLWCMLFIIPGIIAAFRYSQAFFVLADDPSKSIRQCMDESKAMMKGNKMKYFLLGLSFIGWAILAAIPGSILQNIVTTMTDATVAKVIVGLISTLFAAPVYAYILSTMAGFYEILAGHLIKETEPIPLTADQIEVNAPVEQIEEVIEAVEASEEPLDVPPQEDAGQAADAETELYGEPVQEPEEKRESPNAKVLPEPLDEEDRYND